MFLKLKKNTHWFDVLIRNENLPNSDFSSGRAFGGNQTQPLTQIGATTKKNARANKRKVVAGGTGEVRDLTPSSLLQFHFGFQKKTSVTLDFLFFQKPTGFRVCRPLTGTKYSREQQAAGKVQVQSAAKEKALKP